MIGVGVLAALALAFANGANDNAKPVATLVGARLAGPRRALLFGTLATLAGSLLAIVLGKALVGSFSAKGLVGADVAQSATFLTSMTTGAAATVLLATRTGLPISTTHALIGAIVGAGVVRGHVDFAVLSAVFVLPLLTSPVIAFAATAMVYPTIHRLRVRLGVSRESCLCVGTEAVRADSAAAARLSVTLGAEAECQERYVGTFLGLRVQNTAGAVHWASALAVSFARGLQDGAKIAGIALLLGIAAGPIWIAAGIAGAMAAGGLLAAGRVEETMTRRVTPMNDGQALLANVLSAGILFVATAFGAPVSTTHVTTGALIGIRAHTGRPAESWLGRILLSWIGTLPVAAVLAAVLAATL